MQLNDGGRRYEEPALARLVGVASEARVCRLEFVWRLGGLLQVPSSTMKAVEAVRCPKRGVDSVEQLSPRAWFKDYDMLSSVLSPSTKGLYGDGRRSGQERRTNKGTTCEQTRASRESRAGRLTLTECPLRICSSSGRVCVQVRADERDGGEQSVRIDGVRDPCTHTMGLRFSYGHA